LSHKITLLFGATGFLGTHILDKYLSSTNGNIYCLVRRKNNEDSEQRLKSMLNFYFDDKYDDQFKKRIFVVYGDITKENFGLEPKDYKELGEKVDIVVNSAALVKHFGDFEMFKSINVIGTKNIIEYCKKFNKKPCKSNKNRL
jgi:thioester reductase-like protein